MAIIVSEHDAPSSDYPPAFVDLVRAVIADTMGLHLDIQVTVDEVALQRARKFDPDSER